MQLKYQIIATLCIIIQIYAITSDDKTSILKTSIIDTNNTTIYDYQSNNTAICPITHQQIMDSQRENMYDIAKRLIIIYAISIALLFFYKNTISKIDQDSRGSLYLLMYIGFIFNIFILFYCSYITAISNGCYMTNNFELFMEDCYTFTSKSIYTNEIAMYAYRKDTKNIRYIPNIFINETMVYNECITKDSTKDSIIQCDQCLNLINKYSNINKNNNLYIEFVFTNFERGKTCMSKKMNDDMDIENIFALMDNYPSFCESKFLTKKICYHYVNYHQNGYRVSCFLRCLTELDNYEFY